VLKIGNIPLGKSPTIAITLTGSENLNAVKKAKRLGADLLELRIDRFPKLNSDSTLKKVRSFRKAGLPLIATIRSKKEGGGRNLSEAARLELFKKILPAVDAIDLELSSPALVKALVPRAHRLGKRVILSYHNFRSTPSNGALVRKIDEGKRRGGDLVKIAVTPKKTADVARLLVLASKERSKNVVAISMGKLGAPSRVLAPLFGSLLTYASLGKAQAPGQLSVAQLFNELQPFLKKGKQG